MLRGLHRLCDKNQWDEVLHQLETSPTATSSAQSRGGWGEWTPLHIACKRNPPIVILNSLIEAAPSAASEFDMFKRHPLHYAAEYGATEEVLEALYRASPSSVLAIDNDGRTPLHLALLKRDIDSPDTGRQPASTNEVRLYTSKTDVLSIQDNEGNTPLHCACDNISYSGENVGVVKELVAASPDSLMLQNLEGRTPVHVALLHEPPVVRELMMDLDAEMKTIVLQIKDNDGKLPVHYACIFNTAFEVLHEIVVNHPEGANHKNKDGLYPLDILEDLRTGHENDEEHEELNFKSDLMFAYNPNILPYRSEVDRLQRIEDFIAFEAQNHGTLSSVGARLWIWLCTLPEAEDIQVHGLYSTTVHNITQKLTDQGVVRMLGNVITPEGAQVKTIASVKIAEMLTPYFLFANTYEFMNKWSGLMEPIHETQRTLLIRVKEVLDDDVSVVSSVCDNQSFHSKNSESKKSFDNMTHSTVGTSKSDQSQQQDELSRTVLIKFMSDYPSFMKEYTTLQQLDDLKGIIPLLNSFDMNRIGTEREEPQDVVFAQDIQCWADMIPYDLSHFRHALVFPAADYTLDDALRHKRSCHDEIDLKKALTEMGSTLIQMHARHMIYGDINSSNMLNTGSSYVLKSVASYQFPTDHLGGTIYNTALQGVALYPPEMFTKLSSDSAILKYQRYHRTMKNDATVYERLTTGFIETELHNLCRFINDYLFDKDQLDVLYQQASFGDLWARMSCHANLWSVLRPRFAGRDKKFVVVPKTFRVNPETYLPFESKSLPYQLQSASPSYDVWKYGCLIYKVLSGSELFHTDREGNFVESEDYIRLSNWSQESLDEMLEHGAIDDPLARDLLRKMLVQKENRLDRMSEVLQHPFFDKDVDFKQVKTFKSQILQQEREVKLPEESMDKFKSNMITLSLLSMDLRLKLTRSCSSQWKHLCGFDATEIISFPCSFVILPYELDSHGKGLDEKLSKKFCHTMAQVLHATTCLAIMNDNKSDLKNAGISMKAKVKGYLDFNNGIKIGLNTTKLNEPKLDPETIISACEWVIKRTESSQHFLADILSHYFAPNDSNLLMTASSNAKKIIATIMPKRPTVEDCRLIIIRVREAEDAFSKLEDMAGMEPENDESNIMEPNDDELRNETMKKIKEKYYVDCFGGVDFSEIMSLVKEINVIDNNLLNSIKAYAEDAFKLYERTLRKKAAQLRDIYQEKGYLYFVDEYNGSPVVEESRVVENVSDFLSGMRLTVKMATSCGKVPEALKKLFGVSEKEKADRMGKHERQWEEAISYCVMSNWRNDQTDLKEYNLFHEAFNETKPCCPNTHLQKLDNFMSDSHPAGLKCFVSSDQNMTLWAIQATEKEMEDDRIGKLKEYIDSPIEDRETCYVSEHASSESVHSFGNESVIPEATRIIMPPVKASVPVTSGIPLCPIRKQQSPSPNRVQKSSPGGFQRSFLQPQSTSNRSNIGNCQDVTPIKDNLSKLPFSTPKNSHRDHAQDPFAVSPQDFKFGMSPQDSPSLLDDGFSVFYNRQKGRDKHQHNTPEKEVTPITLSKEIMTWEDDVDDKADDCSSLTCSVLHRQGNPVNTRRTPQNTKKFPLAVSLTEEISNENYKQEIVPRTTPIKKTKKKSSSSKRQSSGSSRRGRNPSSITDVLRKKYDRFKGN